MQRTLVPGVHLVVAAIVAIVAVIGLFGTEPASPVSVVGGFGIAFFIVLPLAGIVALGLLDWSAGRGSLVLRGADIAVFVLGCLELSLGTVGLGRWLVGVMALAAAAGLAASLVVPPPRRAGFRR